jgi:hypothetical protein
LQRTRIKCSEFCLSLLLLHKSKLSLPFRLLFFLFLTYVLSVESLFGNRLRLFK